MLRRPPHAPNAVQWGKALDVPPIGNLTVAPGSRAPQRRPRTRIIDIRMPAEDPGWLSRNCTIYATVIAPAAIPGQEFQVRNSYNLIGFLETGIGGVSRMEEFIFPAVGRAIHISADSIRLDIENRDTLIWRVTGGVAVGNLFPGEVRTSTAVAGVPGTVVKIPQFSETLLVEAEAPGALQIEFQDPIGSPLGTSNGINFVDGPRPITPAAFQLRVSTAAPQNRVVFRFGRPS